MSFKNQKPAHFQGRQETYEVPDLTLLTKASQSLEND